MSTDRRIGAGSIPVYLSASPKAMPIVMRTPPLQANAGAVPVRFVATPVKPPYPSNQGNDNSAIPVVVSTSPKAMPVWDATSGFPVNTVAPTISPSGSVAHGATLTVSNGNWSNSPTTFYYGWTKNGISAPISTNTYVTSAADVGATIAAVVQGVNAAGPGIAVLSSNNATIT